MLIYSTLVAWEDILNGQQCPSGFPGPERIRVTVKNTVQPGHGPG